MENLLLAWQEFRVGKRKRKDVSEFEMRLEDNLLFLHRELLAGAYRPSPYFSFYITDPKLRHIHKVAVRDRVVHQAVFRILNPIFDRHFIYDSYSSRDNKGTHRAVKRLETFCRKLSRNYHYPVWILKCDIKKFFDSVDHRILIKLISAGFADLQVLGLIELIIGSFHTQTGKGLPLGNVTSQLFANIYLNELDQFVKHELKVRHYIRYTDDFVNVSRDEVYLESLILKIGKFLFDILKLGLHPRKIICRKFLQGIDFLGYVILPHYIILRTKTKRRMFRKFIQRREELSRGLIAEKTYASVFQSYLGTLKHCKGFKIKQRLLSLIKE